MILPSDAKKTKLLFFWLRGSAAMGRVEHVCPALVIRMSTCSAVPRASSTSMPRYRTVLNFVVVEQELHSSQITGAPVNQGYLCPSYRMGTEKLWV
jgi:hypothetical protein